MTLAFAGHVEIVPVDGRGLVVIGRGSCEIYSGALFARLAELVDGHRSEEEILAACDEAEREAVTAAIGELQRAGFVVCGSTAGGSTKDATWWARQSVAPAVAAARIGASSVAVQALGDVDPGPTIVALEDAQVRTSAQPELTIVLTDDYLDDRLTAVNDRALKEERRWLLANPVGVQVLVGPVFTPARGPCWECLAQRLREHRRIERRLLDPAARSRLTLRERGSASLRALGPALIATELTSWLAGARPGFEALVLSFDAIEWEAERHQVVWRPQCSACGDAEASVDRGAMPIQIGGESSGPRCETELRGVPPEVTIERLKHHVSPVTGVVPSLDRIRGPESLHVYLASGPVARIHGEQELWSDLGGMHASGKGTTDGQARASALCEALERHSGRYFGEEPRRRGTLDELAPVAIHPNDCMRFSASQYEQRERWNTGTPSVRTFVPEPFDSSAPIDWSPAWSLTDQRERLLPTALCYYAADVPGHDSCVAESNGNAAGNTIEEAILHGLLELIERDHVALWWYNRTRAPRVDLESIEDEWLVALRGHLARQERELWAFDLTADLGMPVAVALTASPDGSGVATGFGARLNLGSAVVRAATELVQLELDGASGGLGRGGDRRLNLDQQPFLAPDPEAPLVTCAAESGGCQGLEAAIERCCTAIERQGIEVMVLDQTRPDIGLPVVKVIAPGLRHFWPRLGPGRLYDVPVELGRLPRPHQEHELNPTPLVV